MYSSMHQPYNQWSIINLTLLCFRLVVAVGYYGLSLSITSLAGNKYFNLMISGFVELPAYIAAVFILNR